ncbi:hypothetical protein K438DRAFT_341407 [Mycena galopus ATCC 62051]|nr:hypothetical protein K438DRAFT_341407 [Mycena galopus ATCC 62051]
MSGHSDDENDEQETWFAGGERRYADPHLLLLSSSFISPFNSCEIELMRESSGISVQNPASGRRGPGGDLVRDLLRRAQEEGASSGEPTQSRPNFFTGGGHTLGGEGTSSAYVPGETEEVEGACLIYVNASD